MCSCCPAWIIAPCGDPLGRWSSGLFIFWSLCSASGKLMKLIFLCIREPLSLYSEVYTPYSGWTTLIPVVSSLQLVISHQNVVVLNLPAYLPVNACASQRHTSHTFPSEPCHPSSINLFPWGTIQTCFVLFPISYGIVFYMTMKQAMKIMSQNVKIAVSVCVIVFILLYYIRA